MIITDKQSFLMGVQIGRRLKAWDAARQDETQQTRTVEIVRTENREEEEEAPDG